MMKNLLLLSVAAVTCEAFTTRSSVSLNGLPSTSAQTTGRAFLFAPSQGTNLAFQSSPYRRRVRHYATGTSGQEEVDSEIQRLRSMAAQLRAEAALLEAEQAEQMAQAAERAFRKFDTNQDGQITVEELKAGLEKEFKTKLSEKQVEQLLNDFDKSGDGVLQLEEFVGVDQIRNKLDALVREEKSMAKEKAKAAQMEQEAVKFLQATMELINDRPPTATDKILSVLPYLFPLLDGLQFASYLVVENPDNPVSVILSLVYLLYRSIPFGGFIAFFALSFLSGNPTINRLIRFNMQQAIFLDIALFIPSLVAALVGLLTQAAGGTIPPILAEAGSDALFLTLLVTIGYCTVSSLLGKTPDQIPIISQAVNDRMPTVDMFDAEGRFLPDRMREKLQNKKNGDKDEKKDDEVDGKN